MHHSKSCSNYFHRSNQYNKLSFLIILLISIQLFGCSSAKYTSRNDPHTNTTQTKKNTETKETKERRPVEIKTSGNQIRVLLDQGKNEFTYINPFSVVVYENEKKTAVVNKDNEMKFTADGNLLTMQLGQKEFQNNYFDIVSEDDSPVLFAGKHYRGLIRFIADGNLVKVINVLDLEQYLCGVIPAELPVKENYYEGVKAFAICARTYAITKLNPAAVYDVTNTVQSQVYGGYDKENATSNNAVSETAGLIITYNNLPAIVYYSSTCGGFTEDDKNVFGSDVPYLTTIEDSDPSNCTISPSFNWLLTLSEDEIISRLYNAGLITTKGITINNIQVESRFESFRINELKIEYYENGDDKSLSIFGNNIRSIIKNANNGILKSNNFEIEKNGNSFTLTGRGFGHGVGLCQWGSIALSLQGKNYKEILEHYFPGTNIEKRND